MRHIEAGTIGWPSSETDASLQAIERWKKANRHYQSNYEADEAQGRVHPSAGTDEAFRLMMRALDDALEVQPVSFDGIAGFAGFLRDAGLTDDEPRFRTGLNAVIEALRKLYPAQNPNIDAS